MKLWSLLRPRNLFRFAIVALMAVIAFILYKGVIALGELIAQLPL